MSRLDRFITSPFGLKKRTRDGDRCYGQGLRGEKMLVLRFERSCWNHFQLRERARCTEGLSCAARAA